MGVRGGSPGITGWNWAPLARRADGAPRSSSVTDLMNASSSSAITFSGSACGWDKGGGGGAAGAALCGGAGRWLTSASNSCSLWMSASTDWRSSRTDTSSEDVLVHLFPLRLVVLSDGV